MSKGRPVEARGVTMPMIDDQAEVVDDGLPRAIPPQAQNPPPLNVQQAYLRMKRSKDAAGLCVALTVFCGLVCAGICMTVFLAVLSVAHLFILVVGAIHVYDCPAEYMIPIYLIVAGAFAILRAMLNWYYSWCHPKIKKPETGEVVAKPSPFSSIINLFLLIWLVCGAIWVFRTHPTFNNAGVGSYCDKLTYYTAYWYIIISFALIALSLIVACCMCSCVIGAIMSGATAETLTEDGKVVGVKVNEPV